MNNQSLILYNENTYVKASGLLVDSLSIVEVFLNSLHLTENYSLIEELTKIYSDIFCDEILESNILFELTQVPTSLSIRRSWENLDRHNSFWHINLKLKTDEIKYLDNLYGNKLSRILKFYKNLFSNIDNPAKSIGADIKLKYHLFLESLRSEINEFVKSNMDRKIIEGREKLSEQKISRFPFPGFYHMTHIDNLASILEHGLLSHNRAHLANLVRVDISNQIVNSRRNRKEPVHNKSLHDYVPLYINPLNAMSYVKFKEKQMDDIVQLEILPHVAAQTQEVLITDGNAASGSTSFYGDIEAFNQLNWPVLNMKFWCNFPDGKRIICSEVLLPEEIKLTYIQKIICNNQPMIEKICKLFPNRFGIKVELDKKLYF